MILSKKAHKLYNLLNQDYYHPEKDAFIFQSEILKEGIILPLTIKNKPLADMFSFLNIDIFYLKKEASPLLLQNIVPNFKKSLSHIVLLEEDLFEITLNKEVFKLPVFQITTSKNILPQTIIEFAHKNKMLEEINFIKIKLIKSDYRDKILSYFLRMETKDLSEQILNPPNLFKDIRPDLKNERLKIYDKNSNGDILNYNPWGLKSFNEIQIFSKRFAKNISNKMLYKEVKSFNSYENHIYKNMRKLQWWQNKTKK